MSSSSDSDSDSSSSSDDSFSLSKRLLDDEPWGDNDGLISTNLSKRLLQTAAIHIPVIVATMMMTNKRPHGGSSFGRKYIHRDKKKRHDLIVNDYFKGEDSKYSAQHFRRRFRMDRGLFHRILSAIETRDDYFTPRKDAVGKFGLSPLQKMISAVWMLAYDCPPHLLDEYLHIGESTAIESLKRFCDAIIGVFGEEYLRKPNEADIAKLLKEGEERGFPGMLGSVNSMHWHWKNCPLAWHAIQSNGFNKIPTLILEAIASKDLWIWHGFMGMAGTKHEITLLDGSPLFDDLVNEVAPSCNFVVQGHQYNMGYYLADGIYPQIATLIQTISQPSSVEEKTFADQQEVAIKDVEQAIVVLQNRWNIVRGPSRMWKAKDLGKIMKTCIILHNMIVESEHRQGVDPQNWEPPTNESPSQVELEHDYTFLTTRMTNRSKHIRDVRVQNELKIDLINHLFDVYGNGEREAKW